MKLARRYSLAYGPVATTMILGQQSVAKTTVIAGRREYKGVWIRVTIGD
jgi:hypothetical protein